MLKNLSLALLALCLALPAQAGDHEAMIEAAKAHQAKFVAALAAGDVEAVAACYAKTNDVVFYPIGGAMKAQGHDAVRAVVEGMTAEMAGAKLEMVESNFMVLGDAVLAHGIWRMTVPNPDGEDMVMEGRYTDLAKEIDGEWVYVFDHASIPMMGH